MTIVKKLNKNGCWLSKENNMVYHHQDKNETEMVKIPNKIMLSQCP